MIKKTCGTNEYDDYSIKPTVGEIDFINIKKKWENLNLNKFDKL